MGTFVFWFASPCLVLLAEISYWETGIYLVFITISLPFVFLLIFFYRIQLVQGPRLFTSTGHAYFHLFNLSLCGNDGQYELANCVHNMTSKDPVWISISIHRNSSSSWNSSNAAFLLCLYLHICCHCTAICVFILYVYGLPTNVWYYCYYIYLIVLYLTFVLNRMI